MVIGLCYTSSYTETGGLQVFLKKMLEETLRTDVELRRLYPAVQKPAPRYQPARFAAGAGSAPNPLPRQKPGEAQGLTGQPLVDRLEQLLKDFGRSQAPPLDAVLLEDDADCRFLAGEGAFQAWRADIASRVEAALGRKVPVIVMLASPEVEAWFVADWNNSFGREYPRPLAHALKRFVDDQILGEEYRGALERFGGPYCGGSCTRKLSSELQDAFSNPRLAVHTADPAIPEHLRRYSKATHGAEMLKRIVPAVVAGRCTLYFREAYQEMLRLLTRSSTP